MFRARRKLPPACGESEAKKKESPCLGVRSFTSPPYPKPSMGASCAYVW